MGLDTIEVFWFLANLLVESLLVVHIANYSILSSPSACSVMLADWW
jgi:fucose 4-O-acetylase-like acetyltransferase